MTDEEKPFTVTDRRSFTAEGSRRDEAASEVESVRPASPPASADEPPRARTAGDEASLSGFLANLAAQASLLLYGMPEHDGEPASPPDVDGARHVIALLEMLEDKTQGRRTPEEDRLLAAILYDLRMAFVSVTTGKAGP